MRKRTTRLILFTLLSCLFFPVHAQQAASNSKAKVRPEKRVLLFTKTAPGSYRHKSIGTGITAILKLGAENGFRVDTTEDAAYFTKSKLKQYGALVFLSTNQDVFNAQQEAELQQYIRAGGGFVGIHAATGTERTWPWFWQLVGGSFVWHTPQQAAVIDVVDRTHPATQSLPTRWKRYDEWYLFRDMNPNLRVLATLDTATYQSDRHPANYPFAWYHEFEGGRSFYTAGGHNDEDFSDALFLQHILGGITYAIGNNYELKYASKR